MQGVLFPWCLFWEELCPLQPAGRGHHLQEQGAGRATAQCCPSATLRSDRHGPEPGVPGLSHCPTPWDHGSPVPNAPSGFSHAPSQISSSGLLLTQESSRVLFFGWGSQLPLQSITKLNFQQGRAQHHQLISLCLTSCFSFPQGQGGWHSP